MASNMGARVQAGPAAAVGDVYQQSSEKGKQKAQGDRWDSAGGDGHGGGSGGTINDGGTAKGKGNMTTPATSTNGASDIVLFDLKDCDIDEEGCVELSTIACILMTDLPNLLDWISSPMFKPYWTNLARWLLARHADEDESFEQVFRIFQDATSGANNMTCKAAQPMNFTRSEHLANFFLYIILDNTRFEQGLFKNTLLSQDTLFKALWLLHHRLAVKTSPEAVSESSIESLALGLRLLSTAETAFLNRTLQDETIKRNETRKDRDRIQFIPCLIMTSCKDFAFIFDVTTSRLDRQRIFIRGLRKKGDDSKISHSDDDAEASEVTRAQQIRVSEKPARQVREEIVALQQKRSLNSIPVLRLEGKSAASEQKMVASDARLPRVEEEQVVAGQQKTRGAHFNFVFPDLSQRNQPEQGHVQATVANDGDDAASTARGQSFANSLMESVVEHWNDAADAIYATEPHYDAVNEDEDAALDEATFDRVGGQEYNYEDEMF